MRRCATHHVHGDFRWIRLAPCSPYSARLIHIWWNEPSDERIDPPVCIGVGVALCWCWLVLGVGGGSVVSVGIGGSLFVLAGVACAQKRKRGAAAHTREAKRCCDRLGQKAAARDIRARAPRRTDPRREAPLRRVHRRRDADLRAARRERGELALEALARVGHERAAAGERGAAPELAAHVGVAAVDRVLGEDCVYLLMAFCWCCYLFWRVVLQVDSGSLVSVLCLR